MQRILSKRVLRDIRENLLRYLALFFLVAMVMYMVVAIVGASETIMQGTGLSKEDYALCEYAWYVTAHPRDIDQEQVNKLREAGLDDHQILEAAFVAGFFNYTNRWVSTIAPVPNPGHYSHNRNFED